MNEDARVERGPIARRRCRILATAAAAAAAVLSLVGGAAAPAQEAPAGNVAESVEVRLVVVDALVTDRAGRPILDLERGDFRLTADGEPVEIEYFSPPGTSGPPGGGFTAESSPGTFAEAPTERIVLFLDELHLGFASRQGLLDELYGVLRELPKTTEVMLASFDGVVRVDLPFTTQRKELRAALGAALMPRARSLTGGFEEERLLQMLPVILQDSAERMAGVALDERLDLVCATDLAPLVRSHAAGVRSRVEQSAEALEEFVASLGAYAGRKALLHVSDGIPLVAGQAPFEFAIELCDGSLANHSTVQAAPILRSLPPARRFPSAARLEMLSFSTAGAWERLAAQANTYRVTINTLQASGLTTPRASDVDGAQMSFRAETAERMNDQDTLFALADETGGSALFNTNDLGPDLDRLLEASEARYELAFTPPDANDGRTHSLKLEVTRPGARVQHRKSYRGRSNDERAADALMATLYHGATDNRHGLSLTARPTGASRKREAEARVRLEIPFERLTLLPGDPNLQGQATVHLVVSDERGFHSGVGRKDLLFDVQPEDVGQAYVYEVSMWLARGHSYEIAAAFRDGLEGSSSYVKAEFELTESSGERGR